MSRYCRINGVSAGLRLTHERYHTHPTPSARCQVGTPHVPTRHGISGNFVSRQKAMRNVTLALLLVACSSPSQPAHADSRRWLAGDVHMHVSPPDDPSDVQMSVAQVAEAAHDAKLDFVVLTPHVWPARWGLRFAREWRSFAERARADHRLTLIPGVEWTTGRGHFTVAGLELDRLPKGDFLTAAHAAGAFISVNHPFAVPTNVPGVQASRYDLSYRVWSEHQAGFTAIDGVEVWNIPLALANLISRPGGRTGEERAWTAADQVVHAEHRKVTAVGGTDNHKLNVMATTWVLAVDTSEAAILEALRAGATCIGGPEAGTIRAHGDADPAWVRVGGNVRATHATTLAWDGRARLFVDDVDRGEHDGGFVHETAGALHTYRIEVGASRCGFIYANL
jgi:hypothetical protein